MADETPVQVLHEPGRRAQTKSYMWLFRSEEDDGDPIILYKYSQIRAGDTAVDFLEGYQGYLMCDGYSGYNKVKTAKRLGYFHFSDDRKLSVYQIISIIVVEKENLLITLNLPLLNCPPFYQKCLLRFFSQIYVRL